nr:ORF IIB satellite RNA5 [Cucumber mosaic virus]
MSATLSTTHSFEPPLSLLAKPGPWFAVTAEISKETLCKVVSVMTHAGRS